MTTMDAGEEKALDLVLRWSEAAPAPRRADDRFDEQGARDESAEVEVAAPAAPVACPPGEGFQSTRDREQALEVALRQMSETPLACVHRQLDDLRAALEAGELAPARARTLLDEVDAWLERELQAREARPASADDRVRSARSRVADALHVYRDLSGLLRGFLDSRNPADLVLSRRLGDMAAGFLVQAREDLLQAAPEEPEPAEEGEAGGGEPPTRG